MPFVICLYMLFSLLLPGIPTAAAQTPDAQTAQLEEQLTRQFGAGFLPALHQMGKTAQDYVYAARIVQLAIQKIREQDYQDARFLLEKAYAMIPSPHVLFWLAKTHRGLLDLVRARRLYLDFIDETARWTLTPVKEELLRQAREEITRIEGQLCWVRLRVSQNDAKIYIDGEFAGKSPISSAIPLKPGPHAVVVIKPGFVRQDVDLVLQDAGKVVEHTIALLTEAESIRQSKLFREAEKQRLEVQRRLEETRHRILREEKKRRQTYAAWARGLLLGAAAAGVLTTGAALLSWHYQKQVDGASPDTSWKAVADDRERSNFFRVAGYVGLGITITAVGVSTWLTHLSFAPAEKKWALSPWAAPGAAGFALSWTF